jgi:N,N'-diacetyllegionaminate synthase
LKTEVIAEIGSNWNGDVELAKDIIRDCKRAGASAVKFQMFRASDLYSDTHPNWNEIIKSQLLPDIATELKRYSDKAGIEWFCSVFYPGAVDHLESLGVKRYKVASRTSALKDSNSKETLSRVARSNKPVIISTGMGGDRDFLNKVFQKNKVNYLYCVAEYPAEMTMIKWDAAANDYGFSDHTIGITAPLVYTTLKCLDRAKSTMIEKHVKHGLSNGPDSSFSISIKELKEMSSKIRKIEQALAR